MRSASVPQITLVLLLGALAALLVLRPVSRTDAATPGPVDAYVAETDGDLLHLVVEGERVRIQQPRAASLAELEAAGVEVGVEVDRLLVLPAPTGSSFVIVPPDGPAARLHLLVDDTLHPIRTRPLSLVDIESYPLRSEHPFDRLAVAP
jgi:hypothetical protein